MQRSLCSRLLLLSSGAENNELVLITLPLNLKTFFSVDSLGQIAKKLTCLVFSS